MEAAIRTGESDPLEETYCHCIVDGTLPQLMTDAQHVPGAMKPDQSFAAFIHLVAAVLNSK
jgi:hypothetical protein